MPLTETQELQLLQMLDAGGLSEGEELTLLQALDSGNFPASVAQPVPEAAQAESEPGFLDTALGTLEATTSFLSGAGAEVLAGIGGLAKTITSGPEEGQKTIEGIRKGLTFQPRTESGKAQLEAVGGFLEPVGKALKTAETFLGDAAFEATGSPTLAAAAATLPAAALEALGLKGASKLAKRKTRKQGKAREAEISKQAAKAAPSVDELKNVARGVFKEVEDLGGTVKPEQFGRLVDDITKDLKSGGFRPRIDPGVASLLDEFNAGRGQAMSLNDILDLRQVARGFADNIDPKTKAMGNRIIDNIDSFLDSSDIIEFPATPKGTPAPNVGERLKVARKFWGQAKKSEVLTGMVEAAEANRGGFVNGIRTEFLKLVRNKKRNKFFTKEERRLIKEVADGGKGVNVFKNLSKLKINRAGGSSLIPLAGPGGALLTGIATGDLATGAAGLIFPLIGEVSEVLAIKMTKGSAKFADDVLRAGKDGRKITQTYLEHVPKKDRSPGELAELLKSPDIDVSKLPKTKFTEEALAIAEQTRREIDQLIATGAVAETERRAQEQ